MSVINQSYSYAINHKHTDFTRHSLSLEIMRLLLVGLLLTLAKTGFADTTVLDFNALAHDNDEYTYHNPLYIEDGFTLDANHIFGFASWGALSEHYVGSPSLINDAGPGLTSLKKSDDGLFNVHSIDLAGLFNMLQVQVTFIGTKADASVVTQTLSGSSALTTYTFSGFTELSKMEWRQDNETLGLHQFDNIVLSTVPEPNMAWLLSGGLIGLAALRHKKSN